MAAQKPTSDLEGDPQAANEEIDSIVALINELESDYDHIWEKGRSFFQSVRTRLKDFKKTIDRMQTVSERQAAAIENMGAAVRKWHPEYKDDPE